MEFEDLNALRTVEELVAYDGRLAARAAALDQEYAGLPFGDEAAREFAAIKEAREEVSARVAELEARQSYLASIASEPARQERAGTAQGRPINGGSRIPENVFDLAAYRQVARSDEDYGHLMADGARKVVEAASFPHPRANPDVIKADLSALLGRVDDPEALARHMLRTGSPLYGRAFAKQLAGHALNAEEIGALSLGTGSEGGFAVPFQLDPTLIRTSDGAINPLRSIARVERITGKKWQGVTAGPVTVTRGGEVVVATPTGPVLGQPEVETNKVQGFVPITIELGLAWPSAQAELATSFQDAKDEEEAESFVNGDGQGTNAGGIIGSLDPSSLVYTGGVSFGPEDVYALKNALPPRFRARGRFLAESGIYDEVRQFDENGGSNMWVQLPDGNPARLIGYPQHEISTMDPAVADGADILAFGDFNQFLIVDRIGMTVELIPHLTRQATAGAGYGVPTGQRGVYAHWHNNSVILVHNAFRVLQVGVAAS